MMQLSMICKAVDPWPISNESSRRPKNNLGRYYYIFFQIDNEGNLGWGILNLPHHAPTIYLLYMAYIG